jgi:hypothetical protein
MGDARTGTRPAPHPQMERTPLVTPGETDFPYLLHSLRKELTIPIFYVHRIVCVARCITVLSYAPKSLRPDVATL